MPRLSSRVCSVWFCVVSHLAASLSAASLPVAPVLVAPLLAPVVASILVSFGLLSCASQQVVDGFAQVKPGMTKDEVIEILGQPSSTWALSTKLDGVQGTRLQWGDGLSSLASSAAFRGDPDRAYSVVFDEKGIVLSKALPRWTEDEAAEEEILRERRIERDNEVE